MRRIFNAIINTRYTHTMISKQKIAHHGERETYITVQLQIILPHEKKKNTLVSSNEKKKKFTNITREKASRLIYLERYI